MKIVQHPLPIIAAAMVLLAMTRPAPAQDAIDPARYTGTISNSWLPLTPGTVLSYEGSVEGVPATLVVTVTDTLRTIAGVGCLVVEELASVAGKPVDQTLAYHA